ncbi:MAG: hypothetical protein KDB69_06395, partial [Acidimicrobiia bacterium]|nr:hypothetical protein [Acidimicrobiia bacterium]
MTTTTSPRRFGALAAALTLLGTLIVTTAGADPATAAPVDCSRGVNLSFEEPVIAQDWRIVATPGWATTDTGIEIWRSGFLGATAPDGAQLSELQANNNAPNWQDIPTLGGDEIDWSFFHRGRRDADRVQVRMGSTTTQATVGDFTTGTAAFVRYADTYVVPSGQTTTRFVLAPIDTGSVGNLVDLVAFELTCEISVTTSFDGWTDIDTSGDHSAGDIYAFTYEVTNLGT